MFSTVSLHPPISVPPARVRATLQTTSAYFTGAESDELPSVSTIRECRAVIQTLNDLLAAYTLASQEKWHQLFTDGTTRRQISFQCLVIGFLTAAGFQSVIASSCICSEDETSEGQVEGIRNKIEEMKVILQEWRDVTKEEYPEFVHLIPDPDELTLTKLNGGGVMTDTCSTAQKENRILVKLVNGHSLYCHHHIRNVWITAMLNSLGDFVSAVIKDNLDEIAPEFRVSARFETMCRAFDKEFSLCANYPKGWGVLFRQWMKENYSGALLFHVERACKGRMDVVPMASMAIYWNRNYCVEFLDEMISFCGREDNLLAKNQMILLSCLEMAAVARLWAILYISLLSPLRWLAGKTHKLAHRKWSYICMGKVMDKLKDDLESIIDSPDLIHSEEFMMGQLKEWEEELPEFQEYRRDYIEKKTMFYFNSPGQDKAHPMKELMKELFTPEDQDNKNTTPRLEELAVIMAKAWIGKMVDPGWVNWKLLSDSEGEYSWDGSSDELKESMIGMMAVNDLAESSFGGVTAQLEVFGRVGLAHAAGVSDMQRNGFIKRPTTKKDIENKEVRSGTTINS